MAKTPKKTHGHSAAVRVSPRVTKTAEKKKSGSPGCSRDTVYMARDLANIKFREKFSDAHSVVTEIWGCKEPTRYGYKDDLVKLEYQAEFLKWYEFAFGKKEVQNHYVPLYFARAFALQLKGEQVDWDDVKKAASAKVKVKDETVPTEVLTVKSSNAKGQNLTDKFYRKEDLESLNSFLQSRSSLKEGICKEIVSLQDRRLQLYETLKHREGEMAVYAKLVNEAETNYSNLMSELQEFQQQMDEGDSTIAMKFEHLKWKVEDAIAQKIKRGRDLTELSKEVEAKGLELSQLDSDLDLRSSSKKAIEEGDTKILELREFLDHSPVLSLQPPPLPLVTGAGADHSDVDLQSCSNCEQQFGSSPVVLASCRHPYCLLCISYLASTRNNCVVQRCTWDVNLPRALGLIEKGKNT